MVIFIFFLAEKDTLGADLLGYCYLFCSISLSSIIPIEAH